MCLRGLVSDCNCYTITLSPPTLVVVAGHGALYPLLVELGGEVPDLAGHVAVAGDVAVAVVHPGLEHLQYTCTPVQCTCTVHLEVPHLLVQGAEGGDVGVRGLVYHRQLLSRYCDVKV